MRARSSIRDISSSVILTLCLTCVLACGPPSSGFPSGTTRSSIESDRPYDDPPLKETELSASPPEPSAPSRTTEEKSAPTLQPQTVHGYRIQVYSFKNQKTAESARKQLRKELKKLKVQVYIENELPYYKIRVGDYKTRTEAEKHLNRLHTKRKFRDAWIVATEIKLNK